MTLTNLSELKSPSHQERILIIDFGSQVTQLIARRVRDSGVYCEIWPYNLASVDRIRAFAPKGIILSGGPASVTENDSPHPEMGIYDLTTPILGICYGQQVMVKQLGGVVIKGSTSEFGRAYIDIRDSSLMTEGIWDKGAHEQVWMSHGDRVESLPEGFDVIGTSQGAPFAFIANESKHLYGVQFHPEVVHTPHGAQLLRNFTHNVCGCEGLWTMAMFKSEAIEKIRKQVGSENVICGLSGGVDSSVTAVLLHEAIGDKLTCIYVDTGLMRSGETEQVITLFRDHYNIPLLHIDASKQFLDGLKGIVDPEQKRKFIGSMFIDVFEESSKQIGKVKFLAQGTLYPDVIESVSFTGGPSVTIKSHHNVGGLPERMNLELVEPLRELFKDEVRQLGVELGMHPDFVKRHPFPGPGLAIRIPGEVTSEKVSLLQKADQIYLEEIRSHGLYDAIWQAFAVLLPVKTVGVMGDSRSYDYVCALRAVTSTDGMTADYFHFDHDFLSKVSTRIINEVNGINRVVYDITSKPPGTIEWE